MRSTRVRRPIPPRAPTPLPIYQTATFAFETGAEKEAAVDAAMAWEAKAFFYTRTSNPTTDALEEKVAALEGAGIRLLTRVDRTRGEALLVTLLAHRGVLAGSGRTAATQAAARGNTQRISRPAPLPPRASTSPPAWPTMCFTIASPSPVPREARARSAR